MATKDNLKKIREELDDDIKTLSSKLNSPNIATKENLQKTREELAHYIDVRVFDVNETLNKKSFIPSNVENFKLLNDLNNGTIKHVDMQRILKSKNIKANGTVAELRERLLQVVRGY